MSLAERLRASSQHEGETPFSRAMAMRAPRGESAPGTDSRDEFTFSVDPGAAVRSLMRDLQIQQDFGIATPSHLFSLLHRHLQVTSGAILVPESSGSGIYVPVAAVGLDQTSRLRIRIPGERIRTICNRDGVILFGAKERSLMKPFLSTGDYGKSHRIVAFPFFHNRWIPAVLIVFDSPLVDLDLTVLDVLLAALSERVGLLLYDRREKPLTTARNTVVLERSHIPAVMNRILPKEILAFRFSLSEIQRLVLGLHPHLDEEFLLSDLTETAARLCAEQFSLFRTASGDCIALGERRETADAEMLTHLIGATLQQMFGVSHGPRLVCRELDPEALERESRL